MSVVDRLNAALEGRYEIDREIGEGGMATVYIAKDVKHNRNVAVKVLKPELAAVVGADRFLTEIETTANLQHPHILPLFDSGEADSFLFYVMPYIDGETLADRLEREKQLPVDEAIGIASAVANALHTAHEAGVVHRDIKPGNILMSQGEPLVSDFGIALAVGAAGGNRLTETGLSVGTPYYMSPEQATGDQAIGPASDTYALACVLYEMLVGEPPYTGNTAQAVLGKILMGEPVSATAVRASIPANVDGAIRKALEKLPADRFTGAQSFAKALGDTGFRHGATAADDDAVAAAGPWTPLTIGLGLAAAAMAVVAFIGWSGGTATSQPTMRSHVQLNDLNLDAAEDVVISRDGTMFAVSGDAGGGEAIYIRNADEAAFRPVTGTENGEFPVFSPQGDWIAYVDGEGGGLLKVAVAGGAPRPVVTDDYDPGMMDWGDDGTIVFAGEADGVSGVFRVSDTGGDPEVVVPDGAGRQHLNPRLLPGGTRLLTTDGQSASTVFHDLEADESRVIVENGVDARYISTGHLLYADVAGGLWAVGFDRDSGTLLGDAVPVFEGLSAWFARFATYDVSDNGTLVYGSGGGNVGNVGGATRRMVVVDNEGNETAPSLAPRAFNDFRWSPDGASVAYIDVMDGGIMIFTYNVDLGTTPKQITFEGNNREPVWSPDGTRVAFTSDREGGLAYDLYVKNVTDDSPPERILALEANQRPFHWASDSVLVFGTQAGSEDLWWMNPSDSTSATPYLESESNLTAVRISPSGDLAAYMSDETGEDQVFVRSFPDPRQPVLVSRDRGNHPRWAPEGNALYYWKGSPVDTLLVAQVSTDPTFSVTSVEPLFGADYVLRGVDLHPDGDRWIAPDSRNQGVASPAEPGQPEQFLIVTNWFSELRAALGEDDR